MCREMQLHPSKERHSPAVAPCRSCNSFSSSRRTWARRLGGVEPRFRFQAYIDERENCREARLNCRIVIGSADTKGANAIAMNQVTCFLIGSCLTSVPPQ